jgi:hypothetical protein
MDCYVSLEISRINSIRPLGPFVTFQSSCGTNISQNLEIKFCEISRELYAKANKGSDKPSNGDYSMQLSHIESNHAMRANKHL